MDRRRAFETLRWVVLKAGVAGLVRCLVRVRVTGTEHLPDGPAVLCFSHQSWTDPFVLVAALPGLRRVRIYGPKEEDMRVGTRNRLIRWSGASVPYRPSKDDLLSSARNARAVLADGSWLAIAGEGRIHAGESALLEVLPGPAYFALSARVPLLPVAINGTSWICFGRRVRIRIGEPLPVTGRPSRAAVEALTAELQDRLHALVQGYPDPPLPGPVGRWFTERFNDWPEGARPASHL